MKLKTPLRTHTSVRVRVRVRVGVRVRVRVGIRAGVRVGVKAVTVGEDAHVPNSRRSFSEAVASTEVSSLPLPAPPPDLPAQGKG